MTVRANKPEFNIREKLKSLDYSHVPYEKMPAGSVIQTAYSRSSVTSRITFNSSTPTELHTSLRVPFSLRRPNSVVLVTAMLGWRQDGGNGIAYILPQVSVDGGSSFNLFTDYTGASNNEMFRNHSTMVYNFDSHAISFIDWNTTDTTRIYSMFIKVVAGTMYIGDNQPRTNMIIQEIAQ